MLPQSSRPTGIIMETKKYFSSKNRLYGNKSAVSILPGGSLSINSIAGARKL